MLIEVFNLRHRAKAALRETRQTKKSPFIHFIDSKSSPSLLHLLDGLLLVFALLLSISARFGLALQDLLAVLVQL